MYSDPKRIRNNRLTIRIDEYEHDLIQALANYTGEQPSTLLRQGHGAGGGNPLSSCHRKNNEKGRINEGYKKRL